MKKSLKRLVIDSATKHLYVGLYNNFECVSKYYEAGKNDHSVKIMPEIQRILEENKLKVKDLDDFKYDKTKIKDNLELVSGLTYSPQSDLKSRNERSFNTITILNATGQEFIINTIEADLESQNLKETSLVLPSKLSIGFGIGERTKWFVGAESVFLQTSKFNNDLYSSVDTDYENSSAFILGGFYIPNFNSFRSYWKRIVYRAGIRTKKTGLKINGESINEFGISFGVGLPVGNNFLSNANLGFEFGNRGTTNKNLIKENFINFQLSLSLNDRWFQKRKFD